MIEGSDHFKISKAMATKGGSEVKGAVPDGPKEKVLTYEDYLRLDGGKRYELINEMLVETPVPTVLHQRVLNALNVPMYLFSKEKGLGEVLTSPVDVVLSDTDVLQPDLLVVLKERSDIVKERIYGPPDLVVEVVSPTSYVKDRYDKFILYEKHGIREYWIVYPEQKVIEVWCLRDGKYVLHSFAVEKGEVESCVLKGFKVKVEEIMK